MAKSTGRPILVIGEHARFLEDDAIILVVSFSARPEALLAQRPRPTGFCEHSSCQFDRVVEHIEVRDPVDIGFFVELGIEHERVRPSTVKQPDFCIVERHAFENERVVLRFPAAKRCDESLIRGKDGRSASADIKEENVREGLVPQIQG